MHSFLLNFFVVYIPEYKQQLRTRRYEILRTLNLGCIITLREPCKTQRPRCDSAWIHVTNPLFSELNGWTISRLAFNWFTI